MISVAMATYNGEKYIKEQIDSILKNLEENDELVISDDGSTDKTLEIVEGYCDSRIILLKGPHKGINKNFENAIANCKGDIIFLSDQDDYWTDNKAKTVIAYFLQTNCSIVEHDAYVVDEHHNIILDSFFDKRKPKSGYINNIIKNSYHGCCMAFDAKLKDKILPIPSKHFFHDQWIGVVSEYYKNNTIFIPEKLIYYCRYENNNSNFYGDSWFVRIRNRTEIIASLIKRVAKGV